MKRIPTLLITLFALSLASTANAQSYAGEDSARHYKSAPEKYNGQTVDVDCTHVTRINRGAKIDGVTFFAAHTKDDDNGIRGGTIIVAVLSDKADNFVRKYGDMPDIQRGSTEKVDSKRLRGTFHQLTLGQVYIDSTDGEAHELILKFKEEVINTIRANEGGSFHKGNGFGIRK